jgi:pimeloyl-ACP methyl ester carboxylesterase
VWPSFVFKGTGRRTGQFSSNLGDWSLTLLSHINVTQRHGYNGLQLWSFALGPRVEKVNMAFDSNTDTKSTGQNIATSALDYFVDAAQRGVLFWDVMRQRGNQYQEHMAAAAPHVLEYGVELILDGRHFDRPVNYALVRVEPPAGTKIDPTRRPFVVVDPRAGHGPGIGGFKADSEIGVAFRAGHPCYFVGFLPHPMPGQTIEDIARAEAIFLEKVIELHPDADGKPCVVGNCQAGWAIMMLAALRPELFGPIIIAGSPLSYWGGVHGKYPMRYSGGLLGGSWLTALTSDLGGGTFDGAWLVQNFENQNPANTLWSKQYNLYSKIDTEAARYLGFERWWGGHVSLNAEEIQFIVDELFVGNNLAAGRIKTSDGTSIDLRNIRSPIVVFCSKGDNVTPPQQALGWILDLYENVDEIRSMGQTIVYTIHESIGHLGIFVSASVAKKEHGEFSSNIDLIDALPPGLYEAVFEEKLDSTMNSDLVAGSWVMRCEARTLDNILALGGNDAADERRFATAARVSEINLSLYRTFTQPFIRAVANMPFMSAMPDWHPLRLQYEAFADSNPLMASVASLAEKVRANRRPLSKRNPFVAVQETMSSQIVAALDTWRAAAETMAERTFMAIYGSPMLQATVGIDPNSSRPLRKAPKDMLHKELLENKIAELKAKIQAGGMREAVIRAVLYVGEKRAAVDERGFEIIKRIRSAHGDVPFSEFKRILREQFYMLLIDREATLAAIPKLLPSGSEARERALDAIKQILSARGEISPDEQARLDEVARLFNGVEAKEIRLHAIEGRQKASQTKAS